MSAIDHGARGGCARTGPLAPSACVEGVPVGSSCGVYRSSSPRDGSGDRSNVRMLDGTHEDAKSHERALTVRGGGASQAPARLSQQQLRPHARILLRGVCYNSIWRPVREPAPRTRAVLAHRNAQHPRVSRRAEPACSTTNRVPQHGAPHYIPVLGPRLGPARIAGRMYTYCRIPAQLRPYRQQIICPVTRPRALPHGPYIAPQIRPPCSALSSSLSRPALSLASCRGRRAPSAARWR